MKLKELWNKTLNFTNQNSPTILTGLGVAGVFATGLMAYKAGPKAHRILEEYHKDKELIDPNDKETKKIVVKQAAKDLAPILLPPILMGVATSACIIGSNRISSKRIAVISAAYSFAEHRLKDYQEKMLEVIGDKKRDQVKDSIAKKHLEQSDINENTNFIITGDGDMPSLDVYSNQKFRSSTEKIEQVINKLSARMIEEISWGEDDVFIELNDLYLALGLESTPYSKDFGWIPEDLVNGRLPIYTSAVLKDGKPYITVEYDDLTPRKEYLFRHIDRS